MQEIGVVKSVNGENAKVVFIKKGGCGGGCSSCKSGCPKDTIEVDLKNTKEAVIGDKVLVDMDTKSFNNLALWGYAFPSLITVIVLLASIYILKRLSIANYEVYSILLGFVGMIISYKVGSKLNNNKNSFGFNMVKKL